MATIIPKGIIIHSMAEKLNTPVGVMGAHDFLKSINLSVHGFIHPDGEYEKMIESPNKASHAGVSQFGELKYLNSHFLGVELLVKGTHDFASFSKAILDPETYTQAQYDKAVAVCQWWMKQYSIPITNIVRHSDVSGDHVRGAGKGKTDPGPGFNWKVFKEKLVAK